MGLNTDWQVSASLEKVTLLWSTYKKSRYNSTLLIMDRDYPWDSSKAAPPLVCMSRVLPSSEDSSLPSIPGMMTWEIARKAKQSKNTHIKAYSIPYGHKAEVNGSAVVRPRSYCLFSSIDVFPCRCWLISAFSRVATRATVDVFVFYAKSA